MSVKIGDTVKVLLKPSVKRHFKALLKNSGRVGTVISGTRPGSFRWLVLFPEGDFNTYYPEELVKVEDTPKFQIGDIVSVSGSSVKMTGYWNYIWNGLRGRVVGFGEKADTYIIHPLECFSSCATFEANKLTLLERKKEENGILIIINKSNGTQYHGHILHVTENSVLFKTDLGREMLLDKNCWKIFKEINNDDL